MRRVKKVLITVLTAFAALVLTAGPAAAMPTPPDGGSRLQPFPGAGFFHTGQDSPIITNMGRALVAMGCNKYQVGPGPKWTEADRLSYQCWQEHLGYRGSDADGIPGQKSWDVLKVPHV